jgi:hypothetical protein
MPPQALALIATILGVAPHGNRIELQLNRGAAEIVWISPSTFRFRRSLQGPLHPVEEPAHDPVALTVEDAGGVLHWRSRQIDLAIEKDGLRVSVRRIGGPVLMADAGEAHTNGGGVEWERVAPEGAAFYGLGPRTDPTLDLRGKNLRAEIPFLVSTAGYGEYHAGPGIYRFDFADPARYRIQAPEIDYYFYFGPTPKEIFEEHNLHGSHPEPWSVATERFGSWATLRASLLRIVHGSMSAAVAPMFNMGIYNLAPEDLKTRARQLGSLVARVEPGQVGVSEFRKQLDTFYGSYGAELSDRGFPVWHPLPFQIPDDPAGALHADEFMLGDEMLVAPIVAPGNSRSVHIPRGVWTNLETNQTVTGPKTVTVETAGLPVFARNGALLPLESAGGMTLHYFPKLGGEFFLLEPDIAEYSQAHAAPALDFVRLQIESKKARDYVWVVHHSKRPIGVDFEDRKYREVATLDTLADGTWYYDSKLENVHVRMHVKAGEDSIVNLNFE